MLPNITSIRFLLAIFVVIFHIPQFCQNRGFPFYNDLAIFQKGAEAVLMFFSISGFLIIKQLYNEKLAFNFINLKSFFVRRILRIFPLYYLVLIFGFLYYRIILDYFGFHYDNNYDLKYGIFLSVTFFANIFATYSPGGILEILWSIGIEEQFYLLIAPLLFLLPRNRILLFLILFTIVYFLCYFSVSFAVLKQYQLLFFYFSFSGICSIVIEYKVIKQILYKIKYFFMLILILYFTSSIFKENLTEIAYNIFSMLIFGINICILTEKSYKILDHKIFIYLGKISYGIYMFHAIIMQVVGLIYLKMIIKLNLPNYISILVFNFSVIIITIITAHLSYKYYESYFLKLKDRFKLSN